MLQGIVRGQSSGRSGQRLGDLSVGVAGNSGRPLAPTQVHEDRAHTFRTEVETEGCFHVRFHCGVATARVDITRRLHPFSC